MMIDLRTKTNAELATALEYIGSMMKGGISDAIMKEAAKRLRIGRTSMYRLVSTGAIETVTVGRSRRVPEECLAEYVTRLRQGARSMTSAA